MITMQRKSSRSANAFVASHKAADICVLMALSFLGRSNVTVMMASSSVMMASACSLIGDSFPGFGRPLLVTVAAGPR